MPANAPADELGAHVSSAGGVANAPARAAALDSVVLQLFTKQPNRWAESTVDGAIREAWAREREIHRIRTAASHDSYLINLATPDPALFERSIAAFLAELERCASLDLDFLVTHPGNATDGDRRRGIRQNADAIASTLERVDGRVVVLLETTAGGGTALGARFDELAFLLDAIGAPERTGVCVDTCHLFAAGYDLTGDYESSMRALVDTVGLHRVRLFHLNDSGTPLGSRRDRHAHIGAGTLGDEAFRGLLLDARFRDVPKLIETPKDDDALAADRRNLARLRGYRKSPQKGARSRKK
ncbi:MAG: deoxyribonuclease IV [Longimicrobiales bacterium]